ncbi:hypothetical protein Kpol_251p1 [Vanderwaltozyma polyspora DSM 70294]|uniref:Small ribosomal subunit protein uS10m n=1 Tax=Vanderwaltozyma polyspora (strain ATCC 22028 / DSM 70294 / BCRC 21397 / CBS 2163 / NBRC 10782 / NRRL Y-8283 / UCD 57-17) TaxID=436907 RepID=A7TTD0_VANPO|nr:uncharacterized protein Kpol_251p1 [Vanderwaltozyma polyspora DSM 70294]EDO14471.1 hypothetical protein Kpol_251p1 [Vanderwaltozyma polyspora DSM 70294]
MFKRFAAGIQPIVRYQSTVRLENDTVVSAVSKPILKASNKILPVNVEAVYHAPLRNPIKYGNLVADLQLRSYDNENLDFFANFILRAGYYLGMRLTGPKPLPTRRERWTVIKSPFAQAKSKENFERHTHKRLVRVWDTNPEVLDLWLAYINKHSIVGVGMKCNVFHRAPICRDFEKGDTSKKLNELEKMRKTEFDNVDELVGDKVVELLNSSDFKRHL